MIREYERGLIESLCVSTGLARAPPAEELIRFVELAQNLEVDTIGEIILDKLEDSIWQVRTHLLSSLARTKLYPCPAGSPQGIVRYISII